MTNRTFNFDFYGNRRKFFVLSIVLLIAGIICNFIFGTRLDIQFAGGAMVRYEVTGGEINAESIEDTIDQSLEKSATVTVSDSLDGEGKQVVISFAGNQNITVEQQQQMEAILSDEYSDLTFELVESNSVDPVMGASFLQKSIACLVIAFALLLLYIAIRFRRIGGFTAGLTALLALLHDVLAAYFVFIIFGLEINDIFIAVVLTILGYSLNDTIVIYDRIRENRKLMGPKADYVDITNLSLNQTMGRSIMTSLATFSALLAVFVVAIIYQLETVISFALPMMAGVIVGCYSTLFIATPLYASWQKKEKSKAKKR